MNRRGFIGTLTALAGLALAKIKAPAAKSDILHTFNLQSNSLHMANSLHMGDCLNVSYAGDMLFFKENKIYRYPSGKPLDDKS